MFVGILLKKADLRYFVNAIIETKMRESENPPTPLLEKMSELH
jgi:hypothetical protein